MSEFTDLHIDGRVATPGDDDWDEARQAWNLAADPHPAAVAFVEGAEDVAKVLAFAAANDLRVIGQGTGHGAIAVGSFGDTIVIKTERMRSVEVDPEAGTARIEAGVLGEELGAAAQKSGRCSLPGSSPNVGVIGYTLGGGLSWLGRKYGFACNRVTAIELVTADGEPRTIDADNEPELFWALRGGGGSYAIVTALRLELLPVGEVYAGIVIYPAAVGETAIRTYRDWAAEAPDEITSVIRYLRPPPIPDVPEPLRDVPLLTIDAAFVGDSAEGERLLAPMRALGEPIMDNFARMEAEGLYRIHMDPEPPVPGLGHHALVRELPDEAIGAFIGMAGPDAGSPLLLAELRHLRGALGRPAEGAGALSHLDADYAMFGIGMPMTAELGQAIQGRLDELIGAMSAWGGGGAYFNFHERPCDLDVIFDSETCDRLAEVKRAWDPDGLIRANHAVTVAAA
ncbi:MAG TPA: FAD-binding oxidoreductase [Solirubrobacterales bacterium]